MYGKIKMRIFVDLSLELNKNDFFRDSRAAEKRKNPQSCKKILIGNLIFSFGLRIASLPKIFYDSTSVKSRKLEHYIYGNVTQDVCKKLTVT